MEQLLEIDKDLLLFLNSLHADWLDPAMYWMSQTLFWLPLYLMLAYLLIKNYKQKSWIYFIGIAIVILLTDRITSGFMKPFFERLRPSQEPSLEGFLHLVNNYKGGMFGFASSHAANTFGTAMFFNLVLSANYSWIKWLFVWAFAMTYTRIYLGVHYPGDIVVGALIGLACGWIGYSVSKILKKRLENRQKNSRE